MRHSHWIVLCLAVLTVAAVLPPFGDRHNAGRLRMTVWGMPFEDRLFLDEYARGFEALHPGWKVEYQRHSDLVEKYNAWHVLGTGADVMRLGIDYYHAFVDKDMLYPLDEFINDPEIGLSEAERADYIPAILNNLIVDGSIYALPSDNAQYGLYYNRDLFDAWNAANPHDPIAYPDVSWTWEDLERAAQRLTIRDASGQAVQYGVMFDLWAWPFMTFFAQAGGELWDAEGTTTFINSPAGVEALEYLATILPPDAPVRALGLAESAVGPAQLFKIGRLAMLLDGSWRAPNIELDDPDLNFAIAPLPHHHRHAVVTGSVLWAVSIHSRNPEQAWEMIRWMTNREQSLKYWDMLRVAPPARISVMESPEFRQTSGLRSPSGSVIVPPMSPERYDERAAWLRHAITPDPATGTSPGFVAASLYQNDLQTRITAALIEVVRSGTSAQSALDAAAREVHAVIDRDRAAKGLPPIDRSRARAAAAPGAAG